MGFCSNNVKKIQFNWILSSDASDQSATKPPVPFAVPIKTIWRVCSCLEIGFFYRQISQSNCWSIALRGKPWNKTSQKNESAKNSPHNLNDLFISILFEQMHSKIEKKTTNSPSNAVCFDVRKKSELGCMIKLSETKENSFESIFWYKR